MVDRRRPGRGNGQAAAARNAQPEVLVATAGAAAGGKQARIDQRLPPKCRSGSPDRAFLEIQPSRKQRDEIQRSWLATAGVAGVSIRLGPAVGIDVGIAGEDASDAIRQLAVRDGRADRRKMIRRPGIIGIEKRNPVRLRAQDGHVAGGIAAGPRLGPAQNLQPLVAIAHDLVQPAIGRGVVDHENLRWRVGLGEDGIQRAFDVRALVVKRNDDREAGHKNPFGWLRVGPSYNASEHDAEPTRDAELICMPPRYRATLGDISKTWRPPVMQRRSHHR
jgi:hypothetical protein